MPKPLRDDPELLHPCLDCETTWPSMDFLTVAEVVEICLASAEHSPFLPVRYGIVGGKWSLRVVADRTLIAVGSLRANANLKYQCA